MTTERPSDSGRPGDPSSASRALVYWPIALVTITIALILIANTVSAWGGGDTDPGEKWKSHASRFLDRKLEHMLDELDADELQRAEIKRILESGMSELETLHGDREQGHEALSALMTAQTIDRDAIEAMRATHLARADEMSQVVTRRLADVMDVLRVDQRIQLEERIRRHHENRQSRRHRWH